MKNKILWILAGIEVFIIIYGICAFMIANYFITKQDLELIKERQEGLKIKTIYRDCFCANNDEQEMRGVNEKN